MKVLRILLFFTTILSLNANKITLQFQDGNLSADSSILQHSVTLKNLLDEADDVDQIPIPNIDKKTGKKVIDLLSFIEQNQNEDNLQDLVEGQLKLINNPQQIVNIINATNYLDIKIILDAFFNLIEKDENLLTSILKEYQLIPDDLLTQIIKLSLYKKGNYPEWEKLEFYKTKISYNGSTIAAIGPNGETYILDQNRNFFSNSNYGMGAMLNISGDGSTIVKRGLDSSLYVFDNKGDLIGHNARNLYVNFPLSFDGSIIVAIGKNQEKNRFGDLCIFDKSGKLINLNTTKWYQNPKVSSEGTIVAGDIDSYENHIYVFNKRGDLLFSHKGRSYKISSDGSTIVTRSENGHLYIFDKSGNLIGTVSDQEYSEPKISSDGSTIVTRSENGHLYIFDKSGNLIGTVSDQEYSEPKISSDGSTIVTRNENGHLYIFDKSGNLIGAVSDQAYDQPEISSDGSIIVTRDENKHLYIFDKNGHLISTVSDQEYDQPKINSDGSTIVTSNWRLNLYIFDRNGKLINSVTDDKKYNQMQMDSDGSTIIANDQYNHLYIFDKYYLLKQFINKLEESERKKFIERLKTLGIKLKMEEK